MCQKSDLIARYETLRRLHDELSRLTEEVEAELVELEGRLPDDYPSGTPEFE